MRLQTLLIAVPLFVISLTACSFFKRDYLVDLDTVDGKDMPREHIEIFTKAASAFAKKHSVIVNDPQTTETSLRPSEPEHLFAKLTENFAWNTHSQRSEVTKEIRKHQKQPNYFYEVLERSEPFLALIIEKLDERQMPRELALLPFVESSYDPSVFSQSKAGGLWQFMPSTAKSLGMHIDWWYDERLDIELSTDNALNYLAYLHGRFDNNWELALAAYNGGESHVSSRIKRANGNQDFWELSLKNETSSYVPKLLAIVELVSKPEQYGVKVPEIPISSPTRSVEFDKQIDLRLASEKIGMDYDDLSHLNSGYLRWISPPGKTYRLLIPADKHATLLAALDDITIDEQLAWNHYRVSQGDTLQEIASSFGTTEQALVAINQLKNSKIFINQDLFIPSSGLSGKGFANQPYTIKRLYVVKQGDSLWQISRNQSVSINKIRALNSISGNGIKPGQALILDETFTGTEITYMVKQGDSLSHIASRFHVPIADIRSWNSLNGDLIKPGQSLLIRTTQNS